MLEDEDTDKDSWNDYYQGIKWFRMKLNIQFAQLIYEKTFFARIKVHINFYSFQRQINSLGLSSHPENSAVSFTLS